MDCMGDVTDPQNPTPPDLSHLHVGPNWETKRTGPVATSARKIDDLTVSTMLSTWMSQEVSKWLVSGL